MAERPRAARRRPGRAATRAGAALLGAALGLGTLSACGGAPGTFSGHVVDPPFDVDPRPLTDTEGAAFSLTADTEDRLTLVFFGYTHCPDVCPLVMSNLAAAMTRLDDEDRAQVQVVYVTTDPERDTEAALATYLERVDPTFVGLTGDLDDIVALGRSVGVGVADGRRLPGGGYDLGSHGTQVVGIDSDDQAPVYWTQETSAAQYAADIHTLLGEPS